MNSRRRHVAVPHRKVSITDNVSAAGRRHMDRYQA
jgi:hypothetical protein